MTNLNAENNQCLADIRTILVEARQHAYTSVNSIMVNAYWKIGQRIVVAEQSGKQRADYGQYLIRHLAKQLGDEFGKGFSIANLKNCRQFYLTFPDFEKGYALRSLLSWTHYRLIMRVDDPQAREYYLRETAAIIAKLQPFLLELGKGFSFVGRQLRISTETSHFYIDLVFYNYLLKCFVLIDLKTTKLKHQDIGQMDMYVRMFDDLKRGTDDNPTLGIILCADKDDTVVRYSVLNDSQQLFASKYLHILPSEDELRQALEARHVLQITADDEGVA